MEDKYVISKENFKKYFNKKKYVDKNKILNYYNKNNKEYYKQIFKIFPTFSRLSLE